MSRRKKDPPRPLTQPERQQLTRISRSQAAPAVQVARATMLLAVADGSDYQQAATAAGRRPGDAVSHLVARSNAQGTAALTPRHGGGQPLTCGPAQRRRILAEGDRSPTPEADGTASWSLSTLRESLRSTTGGLPAVSTSTTRDVLHEAGYGHQQTRTWCPTGSALRRRGRHGSGRRAKRKLIEDADRAGEAMGLPVWCTDQAGPSQAVPHPGRSWEPEGEPARQPHEYLRDGTAKVLTLSHPADGHVRVEGVTTCPKTVLHGWLKREPTDVLAAMPTPPAPAATTGREARERWQEGLTIRPTLLGGLPPLRMLLVLGNLAGHKTAELACWLFAHGIMPLDTPVGGSWLDMAESIRGGPDHGLVRVGGPALGRGADAVRVGRPACGPASSAAGASAPVGWLGGVHPDPAAEGSGLELWPHTTQVTH